MYPPSSRSRARARMSAPVWHYHVHYPDRPAAHGSVAASRAFPVRLEHRFQFPGDSMKLLGREPEIGVGQDAPAPLLGLGVLTLGELDSDATGRVDVGRRDSCGSRGSGGRRGVEVNLDPPSGCSPRPLAAVWPRGRRFGKAVPFQELEVVRRRARAQAGQLRALGGGQLFACRQGVDDGQPGRVRQRAASASLPLPAGWAAVIRLLGPSRAGA